MFHTKHFTSLFLSQGAQKIFLFLLKASFAIAILCFTALHVATDIAPQVLEAIYLVYEFFFNSDVYLPKVKVELYEVFSKRFIYLICQS